MPATLGTVEDAGGEHIERTALILVGEAFGAENLSDSDLYSNHYDQRLRPAGTESSYSVTDN